MTENVEEVIRSYFGGILDGSVVACVKMRVVAAKVMRWMDEGDGPWHYDERYAMRHVGFIERFCCKPTGRGMGGPLVLEPFQVAILGVVFGFVDDEGLRKIQECLIVIARKNGKTTLLSAVEIDMLINDREGAPQVYNVATKLDQAKIGFNAALRMVRKSKKLARHVRKRQADLYCAGNMGTIMPIASNSNTMDGLDVSCGVIDELAAVRNRDIYDLVKQGTSARDQPLLFEITTNGFVRDCIFDSQYAYATAWLYDRLDASDEDAPDADRFVAFIFELDSRDEWDKPEAWPKANPGLGTIKQLSALRANVAKARHDPEFRPTVMVKDFNLVENQASAWLTYDELHNPAPLPDGPWPKQGLKYGVVGFDASDTTDLSAAALLVMRKGDRHIYERSMYWLPEDVLHAQATDGNRRERDGVPYTTWEARGLVRAWPGHKVDRACVVEWIRELNREGIYVRAVGYDPWHMDDHTISELAALVGRENLVPVRQGPRTMSQPLKDWKVALRANEVVTGDNPVTEWCRSNASVRVDVNDEIQLEKKGRDPRNRIDGVVAEACAYVAMREKWESYSAFI